MPSSRAVPMISGTRAKSPARIAASGMRGSSTPSTIGPHHTPGGSSRPRRNGSAAASSSALLPRRHAATSAPVQPTLAASSSPCAFAASGVKYSASEHAPLCMIARANSPRLPGIASCAHSLHAPADSPIERDVRGVAAERRDVPLHPLQRRALVEQADRGQHVAALLRRERAVRARSRARRAGSSIVTTIARARCASRAPS